MIENEIHKTEIMEIINFYHLLVIKRPSAWKRIAERVEDENHWRRGVQGMERSASNCMYIEIARN